MNRRTAIVTAFTVEVGCPHCGGEIPSPNGSFFWELREVEDAAKIDGGKIACPECDQPIRIVVQSRVSLSPRPGPALAPAAAEAEADA